MRALSSQLSKLDTAKLCTKPNIYTGIYQEMSQPEHVKDPSVEFVKSRLLGAAAEAKFARDPNFYCAISLNNSQRVGMLL
jgi:hypothetical protein